MQRVRSRRIVVGLLALALVAGATIVVAARSAPAPAPARPPVSLPPPAGRFDYQLGGPYESNPEVAIVVRDWHVAPDPARYSVCYIDAFQTQPEAKEWWNAKHADLLLEIDGAPVEDPNWPDQFLLDTSTATKRAQLLLIERDWVKACADKGFEATEFDNLDSWNRSDERLTIADNLAFARSLVSYAHGLGLAVAQKNAAVLRGEGRRVARFDFAIAESCQVYEECSAYTDTYGRRVFEIEYDDEPYAAACAARAGRIAVIRRDRLVVPRGNPDYRYEWC